MDENRLKAIVEDVVNTAVEPIRQDITGIKQYITGIKETQEDHTRRLEALALDVHDVQEQVKVLKDKTGMYHDRNKREIDEIKEHLGLSLMPDTP